MDVPRAPSYAQRKKPAMIHFPSREWKNKMRYQAAGAPSSSSAELYEIVFDLVEVRFSVAEGSETRMSHRKRTDETVQKCGAFELGRRCQFALATFCCMSDRWPLLAIAYIARRGSASGRPVATLPMVTALTTPAAPVPVVVGFHSDAAGQLVAREKGRCSSSVQSLPDSKVTARKANAGPCSCPCDAFLCAIVTIGQDDCNAAFAAVGFRATWRNGCESAELVNFAAMRVV